MSKGKVFVLDERLRSLASTAQLQYAEAVEKYGSIRKAARMLGVQFNTVHGAIKRLETRAALQGWAPNFDLKHPVAPGQKLRGASTLYKDGKVVVQWVKSASDDTAYEQIIRDFIEGLTQDVKGLSPIIKPPKHCDDDLMVIIPMGDPHLGMHSWAEETGEDFDLKIAESLLYGAIDRLIDSAPSAGTALLLNLGDFFHIDNQSNRSESGNQLDADTRWAKVMQVGLRAMIHCVKRLLEKFAKVVVRNVRGNHDKHSSFALSLSMDAYFSNNPNVEIDISPAAFWYYEFGKVLIGAAHGDTCKMADLPGVMACDKPKEWGAAAYRVWYTGHIHHDELKEYPGVTVESFRTLAARDAWHTAQGYRAGRDMRCIIMHKEFGEIGRHRCDIAMLK